MGAKLKNNAFGTLLTSISASDVTITLATGNGSNFPSLATGEYFYATLVDVSNNLEIVKVTARVSDILTVVRGQDNTTAKAYLVGDRIEQRMVVALFNEKLDATTGYGDTVNPYVSKTAKFVLAAPNAAAGVPTFRALEASDIPTLNQNTTGSSANVTGVVAIANGGTGATTGPNALTSLGAYPATNPSGFTNNAGTVTSVAASAGTGISITGSPITSSGTINITNTAPDQVVSLTGAGATTITGTYPNFTITSSGGVSSVTATSPVTSSGGTTPVIAMPAATTSVNGYLTSTDWNTFNNKGQVNAITSTDGSVIVTGTSTVDLSVAVAAATNSVLAQVRNTTGATLTKGTVVYINGAVGQISTVTKALASADVTSAQTLGLITANLANNSIGNVTVIGLVTNLDTSAFTDGQQLYLSPTVAGTYTATKPYAPQHLVYVGVVEHAHPSQGKIYVKVQNGYELDELHDVSARNPVDGQTLIYNATTDLWEKNNLTQGTGINIANGAGSITVANSGVLGVTATSPVASSGGQNPVISMSAATTSVNGYLTSTDWNTFNNKQAALVSATNIKTVNSTTLLGSGNLSVGTVTSVSGTGSVNGITLTGTVTSSGSLTLGGTLGSIANSQLTNSSITINGTAISLGGTVTTPQGTVTSVAATAGTGISITGSPITTSGTFNITNTAPDQVVSLTAGSNITVTGTYPSFTISSSGGGGMTYPAGSGIAVVVSGTSWGTTLTAPSGAIVGTTDTQTISDKRITPRIGTVASSATITPTGDSSDQYNVTALATAATIAAPSGTPEDGQKLVLRFKDNGTARALTWTTTSGAYRAIGVTLPTTTVISKVIYVGCIYNSADTFWDVVAVAIQA